MPEQDLCPEIALLKRLLLGRVSAEEAARLERHVAGCARCGRAIETIEAEDTLVEAIRAGDEAPAEPGSDRVEKLINELQQLVTSITRSGDTGTAAAGVEELRAVLAAPESPDEIGRLGRYRIRRILGAGGMGVVLEAEDPQLKRLAALKVMRPSLAASESARARFLREARAAAAVHHDHVITIYEVGQEGTLPYLAMELLAGETLAARLSREKKLPPEEVVRIARQIAAGLAAAHDEGVVHRDVKPDNVWLETQPEGDRVKILDFGLARAADDEPRLTKLGAIAGTPAYMAPEQAEDRPVDRRADLFSLGCVLYEACTGHLPFRGESTLAVLKAVAEHRPPPPHKLDRQVPRALSELIVKLLEKAPGRRFQTAGEVLAALEGRWPVRRRTRQRALGWLAAVGATAGLAVALWFALSEHAPPNETPPPSGTPAFATPASSPEIVETGQRPGGHSNPEGSAHVEEPALPEAASRLGPETIVYGGHHYHKFIGTVRWTRAKEFCEKLGGYLACVGTKEEDDVLVAFAGKNKVWLGGYRDADGQWKWVSGEEIDYWNPGLLQYPYLRIVPGAPVWYTEDDETWLVDGLICEWEHSPSPEVLEKLLPAPPPKPPAVDALSNGLRAELFADPYFWENVATRVDPQIDADWKTGPPDPRLPNDYFSIRWTGWLKAPEPGRYKLHAVFDDAASVWLDGGRVIDRLDSGKPGTAEAEVDLTDRLHFLRVDYREGHKDARVSLLWTAPGETEMHLIPESAFFRP